jgi:Asp-tRNA(Asn)/Glu-tRNA(Gln) amidotransferase A subunit family amidase
VSLTFSAPSPDAVVDPAHLGVLQVLDGHVAAGDAAVWARLRDQGMVRLGHFHTHGLLPLDGIIPLAPSMDHPGPMARTIAECSALLTGMAHGGSPVSAVAPLRRIGMPNVGSTSCRSRRCRSSRTAAARAMSVAMPDERSQRLTEERE